MEGEINSGRNDGDEEVNLVPLGSIDEKFQPLRSRGKFAKIVGEFIRSGDVEGIGDPGGGVNHEDGSVLNNFAGVGDANLWVGKLDGGFGDPATFVVLVDHDINTSPEFVLGLTPAGGVVGIAIHDEGGGIVTGREISERETKGHELRNADGGRIFNGARGGGEDESLAHAVNVLSCHDVRRGELDANNSGSIVRVFLVDPETDVGIDRRTRSFDDKAVGGVGEFVHHEGREVAAGSEFTDAVFENHGSRNGRANAGVQRDGERLGFGEELEAMAIADDPTLHESMRRAERNLDPCSDVFGIG